MVAVVDSGCRPPCRPWDAPTLHRLVALAVTPAQLDPASPLAVRLAPSCEVDLLLLTDGVSTPPDAMDLAGDADDEDDGCDAGPRLRMLAAAMGVPRLTLHRLALAAPLGAGHADDVVAAVSELVGFDPEPGVACVVPAAAMSTPTNPTDLLLDRVVERIVGVYRLPLLTYLPPWSTGEHHPATFEDDPSLGLG